MASFSITLADVSVRLSNKRSLYKWLQDIVESEQLIAGSIGIILCSDDYLLGLNKKFLSHDYYTDIITFDYSEGNVISGELYISTDRVAENAIKFKEDFQGELHRVMAHGVLHLCGYADKTEKDKRVMRLKENQKLKLL